MNYRGPDFRACWALAGEALLRRGRRDAGAVDEGERARSQHQPRPAPSHRAKAVLASGAPEAEVRADGGCHERDSERADLVPAIPV